MNRRRWLVAAMIGGLALVAALLLRSHERRREDVVVGGAQVVFRIELGAGVRDPATRRAALDQVVKLIRDRLGQQGLDHPTAALTGEMITVGLSRADAESSSRIASTLAEAVELELKPPGRLVLVSMGVLVLPSAE